MHKYVFALPRSDREGAGQVVAMFHSYGHVAGDEKPVAAADSDMVILPVASDPGFYSTIVKSRDNVQPEFDVSTQTFNDAQDLSVGG